MRARDTGALIVLGGLPGVGKTTIARLLARRLGALHLRVDTIEDALRADAGMPADIGPTSYIVANALAEDNLRLDHTVIADAVNAVEVARDGWRTAARRADCPLHEIEIVCSDAGQHRQQLEARRAAEGRGPTWDEVVLRACEPWTSAGLLIDTAKMTPAEAIAQIVRWLDAAGSSPSIGPSRTR